MFDELSAEVFRIILLLIQHSYNAIDCFWCLCCFAFVVGDLAEVPRKIRGSSAEVKQSNYAPISKTAGERNGSVLLCQQILTPLTLKKMIPVQILHPCLMAYFKTDFCPHWLPHFVRTLFVTILAEVFGGSVRRKCLAEETAEVLECPQAGNGGFLQHSY